MAPPSVGLTERLPKRLSRFNSETAEPCFKSLPTQSFSAEGGIERSVSAFLREEAAFAGKIAMLTRVLAVESVAKSLNLQRCRKAVSPANMWAENHCES
jgi:hypothetical protein